jgi:plasmid stabilization system protein ParE
MERCILSPDADLDLEEILSFIATDSLDSALRVGERFREVFRFLGGNPMAGHVRKDLTSRPLRFFPVYSYLAIYLADTEPVQITRILAATRDLERLLD